MNMEVKCHEMIRRQCLVTSSLQKVTSETQTGIALEHTFGQRTGTTPAAPTFLKLRATCRYRFMRRATSLIHTLLK